MSAGKRHCAAIRERSPLLIADACPLNPTVTITNYACKEMRDGNDCGK